MRVFENENGIALGGDESKKKQGTFYYEGAARIIASAIADGYTSVSVRVGQYGPMLQFYKPFPKDERRQEN